MKVVIVGGGLVGLGAAYALQARAPHAEIVLCDKESDVGTHQSTHNSGVMHCGLYYTPGSWKAKFAVRGIRRMKAFAAEHAIASDNCGKLVVATTAAEVERLRGLFARGQANGLTGLQWMTGAEAREREPAVRAEAAVLVPEEGIIDYGGVVAVLKRLLVQSGVTVKTSAQLLRARRAAGKWRLVFSSHEEDADAVICCAGLQADRVARAFGHAPGVQIVPFRGEYFLLKRPELVRHLIYPVPDPRFPFLGVHFTRLARGGVECGPNAILALDREGYRRGAFRAVDAAETFASPAIWRFVWRNLKTTVHEIRRSHSKTVFLESLRKLVPELQASDLTDGPVGVRAQAMRADGSLVEDFSFVEEPGVLHVINAPSPAATASLAIGEHIAEKADALFGITGATRLMGDAA